MRTLWIMGLVLLGFVLPASAKPPVIRGAILITPGGNPTTFPAIPLLETTLLASPDWQWVERNEIDKVLAEQKIGAILGATSGRQRTSLGKLLQADLLIVIAPRVEPTPYVELVVCETRGGLRLARSRVLVSKDPAADAAELQATIERGRQKFAQVIRQVCAVPPFVSKDLGPEFDHLKFGYARLIEAMLMDEQGVLVVELEEAQQISRELALASGPGIERNDPLYILGEYRHQAGNGQHAVELTLRFKRGKSELKTLSENQLSDERAVDFLRQTTGELLRTVGAVAAPRGDAEAEAQELARRAEVFMQLGDWPEALNLIEASLLLQSHQPRLRRSALIAITAIVNPLDNENRATPLPETVTSADLPEFHLYRRGLAHLDVFMRESRIAEANDRFPITRFLGSLRRFVPFRYEYAQVQDTPLFEAIAAGWDTYLHALNYKSQNKIVDESAFCFNVLDFVGLPRAPLSLQQCYEKRYHLLEDFSYLPDEGKLLERLAKARGDTRGWQMDGTLLFAPERFAFLKRLHDFPNADVRASAARLLAEAAEARDDCERESAAAAGPASAEPPTAPANADILFKRIDLTRDNPGFAPDLLAVRNWFAAGAGTEIISLYNPSPTQIDITIEGSGEITRIDPAGDLAQKTFVMRQPGKVRPLAPAVDPPAAMSLVCYDGKYVWGKATRQIDRSRGKNSIYLLVADVANETFWSIGPEDGLPQANEIALTPLQPGVVAAVGWFGRGWVAKVAFDAQRGPKVTMLHEFRQISEKSRADESANIDLAFHPSFVATLFDPGSTAGKPNRVVLAQRTCRNWVTMFHPLQIGVDLPDVKVISPMMSPLDETNSCLYNGVLYHLDGALGRTKLRTQQIGVSGVVARDAAWKIGERLVVYRGKFHLVGAMGWRVADRFEGPYRSLRCAMPPGVRNTLPALFVSPHYGLVLQSSVDGSIYQVQFVQKP